MVGRFKKALLEKGDMSGMTQKGGHKRPTKSGAGLTQKGVEKYRRQNPGSKLKTAVTTPPSKLKPGSKAAKRRKSFCARSRGWTGERGKAARRRWNCSTDVNPNALQQMAEMVFESLNEKKIGFFRRALLGRKFINRGIRSGALKIDADGNVHDSRPEKRRPRTIQQQRDDAVEKKQRSMPKMGGSPRPMRGSPTSKSTLQGGRSERPLSSDNISSPYYDKEKHQAQLDRLSKMRAVGPKPVMATKKKKKKNGEESSEEARNRLMGDFTDSTEIIRNARMGLAEACWKGYKAKGLKKKGNRMVPNCVPESEDPRMKTTPASIQQGGGDPKVYKQEKAKKDPQPASKKKKKASRRATLGRKDAAPSANHPDYLKKKLYKRGVKPKGYGKEGESKEGLSTAQVNRMGKRGQEGKISKKKKAINMEMSKQILAARKRRAAKGKDKKLSSAQLATIARRAKDKSD